MSLIDIDRGAAGIFPAEPFRIRHRRAGSQTVLLMNMIPRLREFMLP